MFGERYQSALARALGLSQTYVALLTTRQRPVTDGLEKTLRPPFRPNESASAPCRLELAGIIGEIDKEKQDGTDGAGAHRRHR
jgi:hypothetical protein